MYKARINNPIEPKRYATTTATITNIFCLTLSTLHFKFSYPNFYSKMSKESTKIHPLPSFAGGGMYSGGH